MIHLFYGNDIDKRRTAYEKLFNKQKSSFFLMNDFDFNKEEFENLIYASGLFVDKYFIILENVLEKDEIKEFILKKLKDLSESNNNFVFIEQSLSKNIVDKFKKYTENIKLFDLPKTIPKGRFHLFDLTDVLGKKDKKGLWILFQKAINSGIIPDEIIGIFTEWGVDTGFKNTPLGISCDSHFDNILINTSESFLS